MRETQNIWTATGTRHDRITGEEDHTEILTQDTTEEDAKDQAIRDARIEEEDDTLNLHWTTQADGSQTARTQNNLYAIKVY